jgi:hypothetical protein
MSDESRGQIVMKLIGRTILLCGISLIVTLTAFPQKRSTPSVRIEGTYDNLHVGPPESGDLEGMRVILIDGGGGIHAIVQEAAGGVELPEPALAQVVVRGNEIAFTIKFPNQDEPETFLGKVSASGLSLSRGTPPQMAVPNPLRGKEVFFLRRRKC